MSEEPLSLDAGAARALREAQGLCYRHRVAIVTPEHLLAAALTVLGRSAAPGLEPAALEAAVIAVHGTGADPLDRDIVFGPGARECISLAARAARESGAATITAADLARATIRSGEVSPAFFAALGRSRHDLLAAIDDAPGS